MRLDVFVEQPLQLPLVEREGDLITARLGQQPLEVLRLPAEGDATCLTTGAVGRDPFHVEQQVDRPLLAAQRFLHICPRDGRDEGAALALLPGLDETDGSVSLVHAASFGSCAAEMALCQQDALLIPDLPSAHPEMQRT
jgi:hypothetical protein